MTPQITNLGVFMIFLLVLIPIGVSVYFQLGFIKKIFIVVVRMFVQLFLVGLFLEYVFKWDNALLNIAWLSTMILTAAHSTVNRSNLKKKSFIFPIAVSMFVSTVIMVIYCNVFIISGAGIFAAEYVIAIGGMILGNLLRGNIIGITYFYKSIHDREGEHLYKLSMGAKLNEALKEIYRESIKLTLQPNIASIATMGLVFLPGMMTGQILGGINPLEAIKYQVAITMLIFVSTSLGIVMSLYMSSKMSFDEYGILKNELFDF